MVSPWELVQDDPHYMRLGEYLAAKLTGEELTRLLEAGEVSREGLEEEFLRDPWEEVGIQMVVDPKFMARPFVLLVSLKAQDHSLCPLFKMIEESKLQCKELNRAIVTDNRGKTNNVEESDRIGNQFMPWEEHEKGQRLHGIFKWKQHWKLNKERSSQKKVKETAHKIKVKVKREIQRCKETICPKIRKVLLSKNKSEIKAKKNYRVSKEKQNCKEVAEVSRSSWKRSSRTYLSEKPQERKKYKKFKGRKLIAVEIQTNLQVKNWNQEKSVVKRRCETAMEKESKQGNNHKLVKNNELLKSGVEPNPGPKPSNGGKEEGTKETVKAEAVEWSCDPESPCKTSNQLACTKCERRITALFERIKQEKAAMKLVNQKGEKENESGLEVTTGKLSEVEGKFTIRKIKWVLSCWSPLGGCVNVPGDLVDVSPEEVRWARMQAKENNTLRKHRMEMRSMKASYRNMWNQIKYCNCKPEFFPDVGHWYNLELIELMVTIAKGEPTEGSNPIRSQLSETQLAAKFTTYHEDCWADGASEDEEKRVESGQKFNLKTMNGRDRQGEMREKWIELWTGKKMKIHEYFRSGEAKLDDLADYETFLTSKGFEERLRCVKRIMMQHSSPIKQGPFIIPVNMKKGDGALGCSLVDAWVKS